MHKGNRPHALLGTLWMTVTAHAHGAACESDFLVCDESTEFMALEHKLALLYRLLETPDADLTMQQMLDIDSVGKTPGGENN